MWRVLMRSTPNRPVLVARFVTLVTADAVVLLAWTVLKPIERFYAIEGDDSPSELRSPHCA